MRAAAAASRRRASPRRGRRAHQAELDRQQSPFGREAQQERDAEEEHDHADLGDEVAGGEELDDGSRELRQAARGFLGSRLGSGAFAERRCVGSAKAGAGGPCGAAGRAGGGAGRGNGGGAVADSGLVAGFVAGGVATGGAMVGSRLTTGSLGHGRVASSRSSRSSDSRRELCAHRTAHVAPRTNPAMAPRSIAAPTADPISPITSADLNGIASPAWEITPDHSDDAAARGMPTGRRV